MSFDLPQVDPIEAVIACVGVYPVIDREPGKVRMEKIHDARSIGDRIETLARQLANDELQEIPADPVNYRTVLEKLVQEKFTIDRAQSVAGLFPKGAPTEAMAYLSAVGDMITKLAKAFPVKVYTTFAGETPELPSDVATWRWASLLQVIDSPLDVFPLIATGALTSNQAKAIRGNFPTLTAAIDSALQQAVEHERAKSKTYELPPRAEHGVRTWLNKPRFSPQMMLQLQTNITDAEQKKASSAGASAPPAVNDLTSAQKSSYGVSR